MESNHPFEKRIKRHVIGPTQTFFVATAPGLAPLCLNELRQPPLGISSAEVTEGGVVFNGRLPDCYKANLHLRTASRILMRMGRFRATEFHTLERKIKDFPWELYFWPDTPVKLRVTCRRSRLYHSRAVRERFEAGIRQRLLNTFTQSETGNKTKRAPSTVFIRAISDTFHISIDSSGALLFKRGVKSHPSGAPIRETLAAGVLIQAGYRADQPLMDPMCGSGTFALEAAMMAQSVPAGWYRDFAFVHWPAFRPGQWRHIRRDARNHFRPKQEAAIFACDREEPSIRELQNCVIQHGFDAIVHVERADFFSLTPRRIGAMEGLVVLNPPYGRRMGGIPGNRWNGMPPSVPSLPGTSSSGGSPLLRRRGPCRRGLPPSNRHTGCSMAASRCCFTWDALRDNGTAGCRRGLMMPSGGIMSLCVVIFADWNGS